MAAVSKVRSVLLILSGSAGGQFALFLSAPLLARIFSPDELGTYNYLLGLSLVAAGVFGLRLEWAVPLPEDDERAVQVLYAFGRIAIYCAAAVGLAVGLLFLGGFRNDLLPLPWAFFLAPMIVSICLFSGLSQLALRFKQYGAVGKRALTQNVTSVAVQVAAGVVVGAAGLYAGQVVGRIVSVVTLLRALPLNVRASRAVSLPSVLREFWRFPAIYTPSALMNLLGTYLPIILVMHIYGSSFAGYLAMAQSVSLVPATLVGTAVGQVFIGELTGRLRQGRFANRDIYLRASALLLACAVPLFAGMLLLGPTIVPAVLGDSWVESGHLLVAISASVAAGLVASPLSFSFVGYQRAMLSVAIDFSRLMLVGGAAVIGAASDLSPFEFVLLLSIAQTINYALTWSAAFFVAGRRPLHSGQEVREFAG